MLELKTAEENLKIPAFSHKFDLSLDVTESYA